ncbi:uncharacterized protein K460DRAFT_133639 [Cucurbitaria berberidis CBS 394.84]|uniref:Uncharacterized protein n=1 Tax=Cucurbitaria berberidis CBS 394.84 TaxID=1168544 RepID=A0A9P4GBE5_9PLEO|nr:uncharacterized protein K460DRAFT_133639 [Cucurbitaria berberidis CBS 394.84]KAF1842733.1 hypothetical protein K460DRAFT_133639 [Cucurbitaria berberidis CBS 394.84]
MSMRRDHSFTPGANGYDEHRTYDRAGHEPLQHSYHVPSIASPSTYRLTNISPEVIINPDWPPSIRQAAENALWSPYDTAIAQDTSPNETMYPAVAATPFSFYNQNFEMALPQMEYALELPSDDPLSPGSPGRNTNSAIDNSDDIFSLINSNDTAGSRTSGGSSIWSDHGSPSGTLEYHLIGTRTTTDVSETENLPVRTETHRTTQLDIPAHSR